MICDVGQYWVIAQQYNLRFDFILGISDFLIFHSTSHYHLIAFTTEHLITILLRFPLSISFVRSMDRFAQLRETSVSSRHRLQSADYNTAVIYDDFDNVVSDRWVKLQT